MTYSNPSQPRTCVQFLPDHTVYRCGRAILLSGCRRRVGGKKLHVHVFLTSTPDGGIGQLYSDLAWFQASAAM